MSALTAMLNAVVLAALAREAWERNLPGSTPGSRDLGTQLWVVACAYRRAAEVLS